MPYPTNVGHFRGIVWAELENVPVTWEGPYDFPGYEWNGGESAKYKVKIANNSEYRLLDVVLQFEIWGSVENWWVALPSQIHRRMIWVSRPHEILISKEMQPMTEHPIPYILKILTNNTAEGQSGAVYYRHRINAEVIPWGGRPMQEWVWDEIKPPQ